MKQKIKLLEKKKAVPLNLFGKYPDFSLDPENYRNDFWERNRKLMANFGDKVEEMKTKKI